MFPNQLMANTEFKRQYVNRICDLLNSTFIPDSAIAVLDSIYSIVKPEMARELERWNPSNTNWEANVEYIRDYLRKRPDMVRGQIKSYFSLSGGTNTLTLKVQGNGTVRVNKLHISKFPWNGEYFAGNDFEIEAIPDPGYNFAGWDVKESNPESLKTIDLQNDTAYTAIFELGLAAISSTNTTNYHLKAFPNPFGSYTTIAFQLNKRLSFDISVYTVDGRLVKKIISNNKLEGNRTILWNGDQIDGSSAKKGLYIIQLKTPEFTEYLKILKN
jgi:hypothetical protein